MKKGKEGMNMNPVIVRNVRIGEGMPKICVPVVGRTRAEIREAAKKALAAGADMVEWRADWYDDVLEYKKVEETAGELRDILCGTPLLFTFRTLREGGEKEIEEAAYVELNRRIAGSGYIDMVDAEMFTGDGAASALVRCAHACQVKVVGSNHDFYKTPAKKEIVARLRRMQELDADILKIAVMPRSKRDVLTLLAATEEMCSEYANRPVITMSMGGMGVISRLCGETFGSAVTFGTAGKASAPGQVEAGELRRVLTLLHGSV